LANPDVAAGRRQGVLTSHARTATPEEKRHWWPRLTAVWPPYSEYQSKTERDIPVVLLEAPDA
jgi:deazaflavin-dependent oxidoreductase (nitroreductase family)